LKIHKYYAANDNYSQCISCGNSNEIGSAYIYCDTCSPWGFCAACTNKEMVPFGCDTKSCLKCGKKSLKSYKFYGLNVSYSKCTHCKENIGLNRFYWYCSSCSTMGYCYPCTLAGHCGIDG